MSTYVDHTQDDRHFHFIRIGEHECVIGAMPARVQAERVSVFVQNPDCSSIGYWECPTRWPKVKRLGEDIVVHEARVHRESTHKKNDVTTTLR